MADSKQQRELTPAEELAYMKLAQAAQDLREAQEAADQQQQPNEEHTDALVNAGVSD